MKQTQIISTLTLSLVLIFLVACGNAGNTTGQSRSNAQSEIRVALTGNINTLDPQETSATITNQINNSIYNTLISSDGLPELAKSWKQTDDGLRWTFYLIKDVFFHNGQVFTANDVYASFMRIKEAPVTSPFHGSLDNIADIVVGNEYEITFVLVRRDFTIPDIFASPQHAILPSGLINTNHNFATTPVGTGPFKFDVWEDGIKIKLIKNNNYSLDLDIGDVSVIEFYIMSDVNAQTKSMVNQDIDIMPYVIDPELSILKKEKYINIIPFPIATISLIAMNTRKPPFDSLEFRKAVAMAIDKDKVIELAYPSGKKANSFWPSKTKYSVDVPEIYDPEAAKKYFEFHEFSGPITMAVPMNFAPHVRAAQLYQNQLANVGLDIEVQPISWTTWLNQVYGKGNFDMTVIGHTGTISPYQRVENFIDTGSYVGWKHPLFDELMQSIKESTSEEEQAQLYKNIFTLMTEEYPFVFVAENTVNIAINSRIDNLYFDSTLETYDFSKVKIIN